MDRNDGQKNGEMMRVTHDRLDTSRYGLAAIALVSITALAIIAIISVNTYRDSQQTTRKWIKYLALNTPAIVPSGRVLRNAGFANPAIEQRHSPHLPSIRFSLENMTVGSLKPEKGEIPSKD